MSVVLDRLADAKQGWEPKDVSVRVYIPERRIAIASDVHLPYTDEVLLAKFFQAAEELEVEAIVWLGDLMDMPTHSSWGADDMTALFSRELNMTEAVLRTADDLGIKQYWSYGNHEGRFVRRMGQQVGMENLADLCRVGDLLDKGHLIVSDNPTLEYGDDWLLTHPAQFSSNPLSTPGAMADLEQRNLVAGHAHHWGMGKSPSGKWTVIESGGLFEPRYMKYVVQRPTKHRAMCKGFVILDDGEPHLIDGSL